MSEVDERWEQLSRALEQGVHGEKELGALVVEVEAGFDLFSETHPSLLGRVEDAWSCLEQLHAVLLDRGSETIDPEHERLVSTAIAELRHLIGLARATHSDPERP